MRKTSGRFGCILFGILFFAGCSARSWGLVTICVSPNGNDQNPGTLALPVATLARAQQMARTATARNMGVTVLLRDGTYYLRSPLIFTPADSGHPDAPVTYQAFGQEQPVISGARRLAHLDWHPYKNGIMQAAVPADLKTDGLFVNGEHQVLARYPNYDPNQPVLNGFAKDALSPERVARWADPAGGFIQAIHGNGWGGLSYLITGKKPDGSLAYEGGWQTNRPAGMGDARFVENIFEELDAPSEWFLNTKTHVLYYYPPAGVDLSKALVEAAVLKDLVEFQGSEKDPVKFISLKGLTFHHTLRTFMETKEPLVRSDWAIYRGGAIFFNGAENCTLQDSNLMQLGGNAVFVNNYNRGLLIRGCHFRQIGANGVAFVGDPAAARSVLFNYDQRQSFHAIDKTPGPKTNNYPAGCLVDDCLIHETGRVEKQSAPVEIDLSQDITVRHCSIYDCPRAGINIGDGCWGGNVVEFCDVFDTVLETGDHGSFNSWGRDRWWGLSDIDLNKAVAADEPDLPRLDAMKPNILRNSRWRCDHGWDIDLDDGSSNYVITNNLCLHGGLKNREGFYRIDTNNIIIDSSFCPHVWYADSQDVFSHNIISGPYQPAGDIPKPWGKEMDDNFIQRPGMQGTEPATQLQQQSGRDAHSLVGDALFVDPAHGNYDVKSNSPVLALGFVNFPMNQFGVQKPELKILARTPQLPGAPAAQQQGRDDTVVNWGEAQVRNIRDQGEMSVYGLPGVTGVLVVKVMKGGALDKAGLRMGDVILGVNGTAIDQTGDLLKPANAVLSGHGLELKISRNQEAMTLNVMP